MCERDREGDYKLKVRRWKGINVYVTHARSSFRMNQISPPQDQV